MVIFHSFLYVKTRPGMSCWIQQLRDPWHGDARHQVINLHLKGGWMGRNQDITFKNGGKPWKNHGKNMEKPWKNHGKTMEHQHPIAFSTFFFWSPSKFHLTHHRSVGKALCASFFWSGRGGSSSAPQVRATLARRAFQPQPKWSV